MITPQQRGAWRRAYLRQLRKIAESTPNPWMDEIDWDDSLLEDRLTRFIHRDYLRLLKVSSFVLENHPLVVADIDSNIIKIDAPCTISQLYSFLRSITSYGQHGVISKINCSDDLKQGLMMALKDEDEDAFVNLTKDIDLLQIRASIGYATSLAFALNLQIQLMEYTEPSEEEMTHAEKIFKELENRSLEKNSIQDTINNLLSIAKEHSALDFDQLPSEVKVLQKEYYGVVSQWVSFSTIADAFFLDKEFSIFDSVLKQWHFTDISADLLHLSSLMQDYQYRRIVLPL